MTERKPGYGLIATLLITLLLIPFLYAAFFAFPEGDDFASALKARFIFDFIGGFDQMFSYWWKWSGRYSHAFFLVFLGDACNYRWTYTTVILCSFFLLWLSIFGITRELSKEHENNQAAFFATFWLFSVLCSHGMISQWYLLVELTSLIAGYSFSLIYIWSLCRLWNREECTRKDKWFCILSCMIAAGFYEHSAPLVLVVSVAAWFLSIIYDHPSRKIYGMLVTIAAVCFLLVYMARGNFRRQTKRGMTFALMIQQLRNAGKDWWRFVVPEFRNPIYIATLFIVVWFSPRARRPLTDIFPAPVILTASLAICLGFSFCLTIVHALSDVTVGEAHKIPANIAQYSVVFIFFGLFACREWLHLHILQAIGRPVSLAAVIFVLLAGNSNFFPVLWNGITGEIARYAGAYEIRKQVMAENTGDDLIVMPLRPAPAPVTHDTLQSGAKSWPNKYMASFYGLKAIEAMTPDAALAYEKATTLGGLSWKEVSPGLLVAYVPLLRLDELNKTYNFAWLFIDTKEPQAPWVRLMPLEQGIRAVFRSPYLSGRMASDQWPFAGMSFGVGQAQLFEAAGQKRMYAVPLPLLHSGLKGASEGVVISVNGNAFQALP